MTNQQAMQDGSMDDPPNGSPDGDHSPWYWSDDWWAILIGGLLLAIGLIAVLGAEVLGAADASIHNPLQPLFAKLGKWDANPWDGFIDGDRSLLPGLLGVFLISLVVFGAAARAMGCRWIRFAGGFCVVFLLAVLAFVLAGQKVIAYYNLEYVLWALLVGLMISNSVGTPRWMRSAACTEFYIKTGLVLLGAEVLFHRLLALGLPGICVAWTVTPIVLITTFWFGQRILRIESPSLNMVISADMSVCGVSAAIATGAACKAKRSELSLAIGMSLSFTVVMMVVLPAVIKAMGISNVLGGAWIGGTIDSTGAVVAAGEILGDDARDVAATVKMIQNVLIGVVAFFVAVYWVLYVDRSDQTQRPRAIEIWHRFPKFILGFLGASIVFSLLIGVLSNGQAVVDATLDGSKILRAWFFCFGFVSIGLQSNFRELASHLKGGKPLILYVVGQSFNLCLTLLMAWLVFEKVFPHVTQLLQESG
jgi:uncharacterized integral membrane protein (TIGR00698 family)